MHSTPALQLSLSQGTTRSHSQHNNFNIQEFAAGYVVHHHISPARMVYVSSNIALVCCVNVMVSVKGKEVQA